MPIPVVAAVALGLAALAAANSPKLGEAAEKEPKEKRK